MKKPFLNVTLIAAFVLLAACGPATSDLSTNQSKWQAKAVSHYRYDLSISCFCAFSQYMPLHVEIQDGQVVSETLNDGSAVPADLVDTFEGRETVDELFGIIQKAVDDGAATIDVTYDSTYGFPASIAIDQNVNIADEEIAYRVENFEKLP